MIRRYSKRLLVPYVGVIQVAEIGLARAMSADGVNWAIQFAKSNVVHRRTSKHIDDHSTQYYLVATIANGQIKMQPVPHFLDPGDVRSVINLFKKVVTTATIPFKARDRYEYWLLDATDDAPLALLQSTVDEPDTALPPPHPTWLAMPAAQLEVQEPDKAQDHYVPPVNYRLQELIEERAGTKPRAVWFERRDPASDDFPPFLIRDDWENDEQQQLCDLYIQRLAPRLLMMHGLSKEKRNRLEQLAREFVFDVERFYPLYPEVIDERLMNAARVEARLRRSNKSTAQ